jgi:hypothetical protein
VVPAGTDLNVAGEIFESEAEAMAADPEWRDVFLAPPEFWGAHNQTVDGITLRVVAKTAPGQAPRTGRALRSRIIDRLRLDGVAWAVPTAASES